MLLLLNVVPESQFLPYHGPETPHMLTPKAPDPQLWRCLAGTAGTSSGTFGLEIVAFLTPQSAGYFPGWWGSDPTTAPHRICVPRINMSTGS